ncbi:SufD family Fe-S cluster assembly protein [Spiroplasma endosymbiont of Polydrusus formosus]|uniref:SufD family Fe-S cluster assembly protein n=1 Tax=Spiroplasma endosymbiont of Polydrusus formosus TaxID=3139326 RepID=UPI0035B4FF39
MHYIEGYTSPIYSRDSFVQAIFEIFVGKNAKMHYTTVKNWSNNILYLVTKQSIVEENGQIEWIDDNIGSKINMKYSSVILKGNI